MAESSPKPGRYVLTAVRWRRRKEGGGYDQYWQGDTVELTADEAARLCTGHRPAFKEKEKEEPTTEKAEGGGTGEGTPPEGPPKLPEEPPATSRKGARA